MTNETFPFLQLPVLIQCMIFRQYFGTLYKLRCLMQIPELAHILQYPEAWINYSNTFAEFLKLVGNLKSGLYFSNERWWEHGFLVEPRDDAVEFTQFSLRNHYGSIQRFFTKEKTIKVQSVESAVEFLKTFARDYFLHQHGDVRIYLARSRGYIFVNNKSNSIYWTDGILYPYAKPFRLSSGEEMEEQYLIWDDEEKKYGEIEVHVRYPVKKGGKRIEKTKIVATNPVFEISLEEYLSNRKWDGSYTGIANHKSIFSFDLRLKENDRKILLYMKKRHELVKNIFKNCSLFQTI